MTSKAFGLALEERDEEIKGFRKSKGNRWWSGVTTKNG